MHMFQVTHFLVLAPKQRILCAPMATVLFPVWCVTIKQTALMDLMSWTAVSGFHTKV